MRHLFITGFMGAGKSSVGRLVADRLGLPFVDLDAEIERREGKSVRELFSAGGEERFREAEHAALQALASAPPSVVATGGGIVLRDDNRVLLGSTGTVVYLAVTPKEAMARIGDAADRPLLAGRGLSAAREVLAARVSLYAATADHTVQTVGRDPGQVAAAVLRAIGPPAHVARVGVAGGAGGYEVMIGPGLLAEAGARIREATGARVGALVSDETVDALHGAAVAESLAHAGVRVVRVVVAPGEESKSWERAGELLERFAEGGLDRTSAVVALGGGVVGDLAGFCASAYMRGVALVHLPTTLLAQVDSAIGGKTAVDLAAGKNLAGAFWPPRLVVADTDTLATLTERELTNGLVEAAKGALLAGAEELRAFEDDVAALRAGEAAAVGRIVVQAAAFKAGIVSADERESGLRESLNLGHTLGHAIERVAGYGAVSHGLAVAEGMRFAAVLAERLSGAPPETAAHTEAVLDGIGASRAAFCAESGACRLEPERLLEAMKADKKSRAGAVRFVLLRRPGEWSVVPIDDDVLVDALARWSASLRDGRA